VPCAKIEHMNGTLQCSLLDLTDSPGLAPLDGLQRTELAHEAWVDTLPGWLAGADELFGRLLRTVPWRAERRAMYDRVVDVPRLLCFYDEAAELPDPLLTQARQALDEHYASDLGERFVTAGLCLYRDGRDSVAWHGDTIGRGSTQDTMVAILSLGTPRPLLLRPLTGGGLRAIGVRGVPGEQGVPPGQHGGQPALRYDVGHGDLLVMGGSCQRTWQHAVPKTARPTGPRISVQFRPRGVR
jgi:alkylated DNA repair dioxygenase AlkB